VELRGKDVLVVGVKRSGMGAIELLQKRGARVRAMDAQVPTAAEQARFAALGVPVVSQEAENVGSPDLIVLSPAVPFDLPLFAVARERGVPVIGEVELAAYFLRGPVIGITGSNGKTTTTALVGHLLRECGVPCQVGGNIGTAVSSLIESSREEQWNVLELSSFQLETIDRFRAHIAACLNVTPDHLDRHGSLDNYARAKGRLFETQIAGDFAVLNYDDAICRGYARHTRAEVFWCQGFSEPGAGSDLAGLQTRAVRDGDDYVVDGQKIWTSEGHQADWMILLARTDTEAPKHRGISYFLVDMRTPGIQVRPLVNLMNGHAFNEVFFENVRVPKSNLVGAENGGWYVATTTLDFERSGITRVMLWLRMLEEVVAFVREAASRGERWAKAEHVRNKLADLRIEFDIARLLARRVAWLQSKGIVPNYEASMAKLYGTEVNQRFCAAAINFLGMAGQLDPGSPWAGLQGRIERAYMAAVSYTIAGGTSEIQRNVIATRGLGLPR